MLTSIQSVQYSACGATKANAENGWTPIVCAFLHLCDHYHVDENANVKCEQTLEVSSNLWQLVHNVVNTVNITLLFSMWRKHILNLWRKESHMLQHWLQLKEYGWILTRITQLILVCLVLFLLKKRYKIWLCTLRAKFLSQRIIKGIMSPVLHANNTIPCLDE